MANTLCKHIKTISVCINIKNLQSAVIANHHVFTDIKDTNVFPASGRLLSTLVDAGHYLIEVQSLGIETTNSDQGFVLTKQ